MSVVAPPSPNKEQKQFGSYEEFMKFLGANKIVNKILVANNGLAAVKGINSIRQWCFSHLDIAAANHCIEFEVMATPEDLSVDAEFCHLADHYVEVPGGKNLANYANVDLIVQTAIQQRCDAVYPGWGHASENPALPRDLLNKTKGRVTFFGPGETAMFSLGDKIASTIIAQSFGVPCVGWSGSHVRIPEGAPPGVVPVELHDKAFVHSLEECVDACERVGYPVMLKASEGGGGKGIRRVTCLAEVASCFSAVKDEVANCHIFVMKMLKNVRHLEVQLLADAYGDCIAVRTRDCSVQRRHQKIIEEGPVVGVDPKTVEEMEQAAVRMAKAVGYIGLGTVEYMYDRETGKYHFLELNPRVQVEHPVSELISGVNLPAALMCVCCGVPLSRIPEVRKFYGLDKYGTSKIDFNNTKSLPPKGHAIAVRITAEDAEEGFRPTTGAIEEISFKDSEDCWGYFSVGHGRGGIHQFADSQFGHIFAHSATREEARRAIILSLSSLVVRGEIRYSTPFVVGLLERKEFIDSAVHTAWLDGILAGEMIRPSERFIFQALAAGAVFRLCRQNKSNQDDYLKALAAGHTPASHYLEANRTDTFVLEGKKYTIHSGMVSPSIVALSLNGSVLQVHFRELQASGAMQLQLGNRNVVAHVEEEAIGCRVSFSSRTIVLTADADPTKLRASVSGKLVRYLVGNGDHIEAGSPYCEIEVMKMIYPLVCNVSGTLTLRAAPGATLHAGKLLAEIEPDDPSTVARAEADLTSGWPETLTSGASLAQGQHIRTQSNTLLPESEPPTPAKNAETATTTSGAGNAENTSINTEDSFTANADSLSRARQGVKMLWTMLQGYHPSSSSTAGAGTLEKLMPVTNRVDACLDELTSLAVYSVKLNNLGLPFITFGGSEDGSIPATAAELEIANSTSPIQKLTFVLRLLLNSFVEIEQHFNGHSRGAALEILRKQHEDDLKKVFEIDFIHHQKHRVEVAKRLLQVLGQDRVLLIRSIDLIKNITTLTSHSTSSLVLQARFLLRNAQGPTFEDQKVTLRSQLDQGLGQLVKAMSVSTELACAVLFDTQHPNTVPAILEFILRRIYYGEAAVTKYDVFRSNNDWRFTFALESADFGKDVHHDGGVSVFPIHKVRLADAGFGVVILEDRDLEASVQRFGDSCYSALHQQLNGARDKTVSLVVFAKTRSDAKINDLAEQYQNALNAAEGFQKIANEVSTCYITFVAYGAPNSPYIFTYSRSAKNGQGSQQQGAPFTPISSPASSTPNVAGAAAGASGSADSIPATPSGPSLFTEDKMLRNVFAPTAGRLETRRLEEHYNVSIIPQFGDRKIHLYVASPKVLPGKGVKEKDVRRLFVRCFFTPADFMLQPWDCVTDIESGQILTSVINAVELAFAEPGFTLTKMNHLFLNLVELSLDVEKLPLLLKSISKTFGESLKRLRFGEVEISFRVPYFKEGDKQKGELLGTVPCRIFVHNTTGYAVSAMMFAEILRADGHTDLIPIETAEDVEKYFTSPYCNNKQHADPTTTFQVEEEEGDAEPGSTPLISSNEKGNNVSGWGSKAEDRLAAVGSSLDVTAGQDDSNSQLSGENSSSNNKKINADTMKNMMRKLSLSLPRQRTNLISGLQADVPLKASEAYPPLTQTQIKRLQAQSTGTTYAYDWLLLLEVAAKRSWKQFRKERGCVSPDCEAEGVPEVPSRCVTYCQLALSAEPKYETLPFPPVVEVSRDFKQTCGMLAWKVDILLPAQYHQRIGDALKPVTLVVVANDITWENGAFSIREDRVFAAASVYARENKYPFLYLSANSGARIGLSTDVQNRFRAALKESGGDVTLDYIYLGEEDVEALKKLDVRVVTEKLEGTFKNDATGKDEIRYKLVDVIGSAKDPIGVENLQGSALLAGQMSLNYATVPTLSVVSGRSVGIGAYLNRLGRRVIQVQGAPIILTGFQAINRLLGKEVYSSQDQLGGNDIMQPNGVSHWGASNDLTAVNCALRWLYQVGAAFEYKSHDAISKNNSSFVAPHVGQRTSDSWDRDVTFTPRVATPYDPRLLIDAASDGSSLGIFDKGSFHESLTRWAASVVTGRATLGGIPVGVISVETRTTTKIDPADPADLESRAAVLKQAGQVWFPDSSRKTADAMEDFRNEGLPCFVIANWRGFSGGMRDMYNEVLKFGASIVDNLRVYDQPVIIYIPPFGELRGGSWVVVDPVINHNGCVEMFADPLSRGGILEPNGIVNVKFKDQDVRALWRRSREASVRASLKQQHPSDDATEIENKLKKVEEKEHALFLDIAVTFADLHDTPGRMLAVKCINNIVPLKDSRRYFYWVLRRQMIETSIARAFLARKVDDIETLGDALTKTRALVAKNVSSSTSASASAANLYDHEEQKVKFLESSACYDLVKNECTSSQLASILGQLKSLGSTSGQNVSAIEELLAKTFKK